MGLPSLFSHIPLLIVLYNSLFTYSSSISSPAHAIPKGSSISVDRKNDNLVSPNSLFTAGFYEVGINAYCFSIWLIEPQSQNVNPTVVWMANRDAPVNGKHSKLFLHDNGNLVLQDADQSIVWSTETKSASDSLTLQLEDTGNLVLRLLDGDQNLLWQSFDHPTDTLLPDQVFTKNSELVSSRSKSNFSSGFFKLYFETNNILSLLYKNPEITSVYWPKPYSLPWKVRRSTYNNSRIAKLNSQGHFKSSDDFHFFVSDFGMRRHRIMKLDSDGNIRVYSLVDQKEGKKWEVQWQAFSNPCKIHGVCGPNSVCTYSQETGRKCVCVHGYKKKNQTDWTYGCAPKFKPCKQVSEDYVELPFVKFYGFEIRYLENRTLDACKQVCLKDCNCKGFHYKYFTDKGYYSCSLKNLLYNGYQLAFRSSTYIKLPKDLISSVQQTFVNGSSLSCPENQIVSIQRSYDRKHGNSSLKILLKFGYGIGLLEFVFVLIFFYITLKDSSTTSYFQIASGIKRFTFAELKTATRNFKEEIGKGGSGVVYKGKLSDERPVGIKMLKEVYINQGEAEFQAELSTIGRLNHMNLIETLGYCIEGKHRLVVYEYMENGSLATCLNSNKLDWGMKLEIAIGIAKGLAYLHEECLEWVLHCDVKPDNVLLDANYCPKVADFGLSKLFDRGSIENPSFSKVRGTRGYMAPEWVFNLPITSKVDVYGYGVVVLEMITGKSPLQLGDGSHGGDQTLVEWVKQKIYEHIRSENGTWIEEIVDGRTSGEYDMRVLINLVKVALQCAQEDKDARPSMSQVVNIILNPRVDDLSNSF
ncbi:putative receptor protein kinase ZmPK1 [Lactuca sativa]|uniref:putative receptor protein kinase ZmPK1 n=1 Tax=Lactuca sativa TaxID=4236 RepID=UPI000CC669D3|nr:putative receptor protein kinase ZmPK1 [Lactuca sativa]